MRNIAGKGALSLLCSYQLEAARSSLSLHVIDGPQTASRKYSFNVNLTYHDAL